MKTLRVIAASGVCILVGCLLVSLRSVEVRAFFARLPHRSGTKADAQRVHRLRTLKREIVEFHDREGVLPSSISELEHDGKEGRAAMVDPVSGLPFEYGKLPVQEERRPTDPHPTFRICADFQAPSPLIYKNITPPCPPGHMCLARSFFQTINPIAPGDPDVEFWDHVRGHGCWTFDAKGRFISSSQKGDLR